MWGRNASLFPPPNLVHPHRVFEPAQLGVAPIVEEELLAGDKLTHDVGGQYLAGIRLRRDSRCHVHRRPEAVTTSAGVVLRNPFACVQANTNPDRLVGRVVVLGERAPKSDWRSSLQPLASGHDLTLCDFINLAPGLYPRGRHADVHELRMLPTGVEPSSFGEIIRKFIISSHLNEF